MSEDVSRALAALAWWRKNPPWGWVDNEGCTVAGWHRLGTKPDAPILLFVAGNIDGAYSVSLDTRWPDLGAGATGGVLLDLLVSVEGTVWCVFPVFLGEKIEIELHLQHAKLGVGPVPHDGEDWHSFTGASLGEVCAQALLALNAAGAEPSCD